MNRNTDMEETRVCRGDLVSVSGPTFAHPDGHGGVAAEYTNLQCTIVGIEYGQPYPFQLVQGQEHTQVVGYTDLSHISLVRTASEISGGYAGMGMVPDGFEPFNYNQHWRE